MQNATKFAPTPPPSVVPLTPLEQVPAHRAPCQHLSLHVCLHQAGHPHWGQQGHREHRLQRDPALTCPTPVMRTWVEVRASSCVRVATFERLACHGACGFERLDFRIARLGDERKQEPVGWRQNVDGRMLCFHALRGKLLGGNSDAFQTSDWLVGDWEVDLIVWVV